MNRKTFLIFGISGVILSLTWVLITPLIFPPEKGNSSIVAPHPGFIAPEFELNTPHGETYSLQDFNGQPVLIFFWASWCTVCKSVMPGLESVYQDFEPQGFKILAINATKQDVLNTAIQFFGSKNYSYPMLIDVDGVVAEKYFVRALPTAILIGRDGSITDVAIGSSLSEGFLRAKVEEFILEGVN